MIEYVEVDGVVLQPASPWLKIYAPADRYPKVWRKGIIQRVLILWARGCCENCDRTHEDSVILVHQLSRHAKHDCRWQNLLVCCKVCQRQLYNRHWQPGELWPLKWGEFPRWAVIRGIENGQ